MGIEFKCLNEFMNALDKKTLLRFKSLLERRLSLHKMVLFGSRARENMDSDSDMDVLVVLEGPNTKEARDQISDCAWEAGFENGIVVAPVVFSRNDWENGPERSSLLAQAVEKEGVPI